MAKISELDLIIKELRSAAESITAVADGLIKLFSAAPEPEDKKPEPAANPVTLEDVRKVLANHSRNGKTEQVKALLTKYGAERLSDITNPDTLVLLFKDAEALA